VIGAFKQSGMIAAVTLRLLYLIFQQMLGLVLVTDRAASSKNVELFVLRHEVAVPRRGPAGDHRALQHVPPAP